MKDSTDELGELARDIQRVIADNRKFLERVMDDEFEPEDAELDEISEVVIEEEL